MRTLLFLITSLAFYGKAQNITHGPIVGGVSSTSVRMYARTNTPTTIEVQLSTSQLFSSYTKYNLTTSIATDNSGITTLSGLSPNTKYFYRLKISSVQQGDIGSFTTFPTDGQDGNYTLLFGSCIDDTTSDAVFLEMQKHQCNLFLQTGDWIYSDENNDPENGAFYANTYYKIANEYHKRYSSVNMNDFMLHNPLDYIYDDHDFVQNNSTATGGVEFEITWTGVTPTFYPFPSYARTNVIKAYTEYFPGYSMVDTSEGIYHKITLGNIDIFVIDNRSARSSNIDGLQEIGGNYYFVPNANHTMLGKKQLNWLLSGLKNSAADWKIIVGGVTFNQKYQEVVSNLLALPSLLGIPLASAMMDGWAGYALEQDSILNYLKQECINNVVFISGDSHTSAIDDGTYAGVPEIMAANLHKSNSQVATMIDYLLGIECWSFGAQGIGNTNYNNAFGKIETYQDDSLVMKIIDTYGTTVIKGSVVNVKPINASVSVDSIGGGKFSATVSVSGGELPYSYKWSTGSTKSTETNLSPGQYYVIVSDANGCTDSVSVPVSSIATSIASYVKDDFYFDITPNPTRGKVYAEVKLPKSESIVLELLNVEGQIIKEIHYPHSKQASLEADLSNYDEGIYFIKLTAGDYSIVKRLIKVNY